MNKLREIVEKMSSVEWTRDGLKIMTPNGEPVARIAKWSKEQDQADAIGIVTLRNLAPDLLAVVEAARALDDWYNDPEAKDNDVAYLETLLTNLKTARKALDAKLTRE